MKFVKSIIITILLFSTILNSKSQENIRIKKKKFHIEIKDVGFKDAWKKIKKAERLYSRGLGTFTEALTLYLKAVKYNSECATLNYKIGVCYLATDKFYNATEYLERAYLKDNNVASDIYFVLARAYHLNLEFDQAIKNYKAYYGTLSKKQLRRNTLDINKYIKECRFGKEITTTPVRVIINNLGRRVNSKYDDYNPVIDPKQNLLYFTSRRKIRKRDKRIYADNKYYENILVSEQAGELWKKAKLVDNKIDSKNNESVLVISHDGNFMYIYNGSEDGGNISVSKFKKGKWRKPKKISRRIRSNKKETSITFNPTGDEMFFVSNKKGTLGGMDIFYSKKNKRGRWSKPSNMGASINTIYDEEGVFWHPTENKLYFSSEGHNSMGGYDIFYIERNEKGIWSEPKNMGYPINSPNDDVFFKIDKNNKQAYYSSVRRSGFGGKDLYKITFLGEEKEMKPTTDSIYLAWTYKQIDNLFYNIPNEIKVDTSLYMVGKITDSESGDKIELAKLEIIDLEKNKIISTAIADTLGLFKIKIPKGKNFGVEVTAKSYLFFIDSIDMSTKQVVNSKIEANFQLTHIDVGAKMILKNIFFETNKATIKSESEMGLERLANLLIENPSIRLEISGHTDNIGSYKANKKLSESRAKKVVDYIISKGVNKNRLEYKGYSFNQPIANNNTSEGRAKNRRVEFKVIGK